MASRKASKEDSTVVDDYRAVVRTAAANARKNVDAFLKEAFGPLGQDDKGVMVLTCDSFEVGFGRIKTPDNKLSWKDLNEVFAACDDGGDGKVPLDEFYEFSLRTSGNVLTLALKLRALILREHETEENYRRLFNTIEKNGTDASKDGFRSFVEEEMGHPISESESLALYAVVDSNRDGRLSVEDFLEFLVSQSGMAARALTNGSSDVIVDMRVSNTREEDGEYLRQGYTHVKQIGSSKSKAKDDLESGTFGGGQSLWVWWRRQGTANGRLKAIIDIQLEPSNMNTNLVINGFTCLKKPMNGKYIWIRRAKTVEEERDAILDVSVTTGRVKNAGTDPIFKSPGVGWSRADHHMSSGIITSTDYLLWTLALRPRTSDSYLSRPKAVGLSTEGCFDAMTNAVRDAFRHYVPADQMAMLCEATKERASSEGGAPEPITRVIEASYDMTSLFHKFADNKGRMYKAGFSSALIEVGARVDSVDTNKVFYFFDTDVNGYITRESFTRACVLTAYEIDSKVEMMKKKLSYDSGKDARDEQTMNNGVRQARMLSEVYKMLSRSVTKFLSVTDIQTMGARLNFFLTEEEAHMMEKRIDKTGDGRIEEIDFVRFMEEGSVIDKLASERTREAALKFKMWISSSGGSVNNEAMWNEFKKFHDKTIGTLFLGYLQPSDLRSVLAIKLKVRLSPHECKLFSMLIAPQGHGQVRQQDVKDFAERKCRSFGELKAILERDFLRAVVDVYKDLQQAYSDKNGSRVKELKEELAGYSDEIKDVVQSVAVSGVEQSNATGNSFMESGDISTLSQVKDGFEEILADQHELDDHQLLNLEEWAMISIYVGHISVSEGNYGVKMDGFVMALCEAIAGKTTHTQGKSNSAEDDENLDSVCRTLQSMIRDEASRAAVMGSGKAYDFKAPFDLFDTDRNGKLSQSEFKAMLEKLRVIDGINAAQIGMLVSRFDISSRGYITLEDFQLFAESESYGLPKPQEHHVGADKHAALSMGRGPPAAITRDSDCDILLWHLWRRCCTMEPLDPESLVTALERACAEIEMSRDEACVSARELWSLLAELDMRAGLSSADFQRGVSSLTKRGRAGELLVDAVALCRCTVRMGRAHVAMEREARVEEERAYHELVMRLQGELQSLGEVSGSTVKGGRRGSMMAQPRDVQRFEHVMHRLDDDGDGCLNVHEFQIALRRLRSKDARQWADNFVLRLFEEVDPHSIKVVNIKDFAVMVRNGELGRQRPEPPASNSSRSAGGSQRQLSLEEDDLNDDGEDEENVFARVNVVQDHALMRKTYEALAAVVPRSGTSTLHVETVCGAVRRFFERSDPSGRGIVTDDRFRTFCRRSGLQDVLTLSDVRRLVDRLRRRRPSGQDRSATMVDYDKFCEMLQDTASALLEGGGGDRPGGSDSRADAVLLRLQDAAASSANQGRSFPALCSLLDQRNTGFLLRDELIHVAKMMGTTLTAVDVELLIGLMPAKGLGDGGNSLSHNELLKLMEDYIPRSRLSGDLIRRTPVTATARSSFDFDHTALRPSGALPLYASPRVSTHAPTTGSIDQISLLAPEGPAIRTPLVHASTTGNTAFEPNVLHVADRLRAAQDVRARNWGRSSGTGLSNTQSLSLIHQCGVLDVDGRGFLPMRSLQSLTDGLGVTLNSTDIAAIRAMFGSGGADDNIDYRRFCDFVQRGDGATKGASSLYSALAPENVPPTPGQPLYMTEWTMKRLREAKTAGQNPRDLFEAIDIERTGLVDIRRFRDVLERIDLLQSDRQIDAAVQDWGSVAAKNLIDYSGFCAKLERALNRYTPGGGVPGTPMTAMRSSLDRSMDMGASTFGYSGGLSHPGTPAYGGYGASYGPGLPSSPMGDSIRDFQFAHTASTPAYEAAAGRYRDVDVRASGESSFGRSYF